MECSERKEVRSGEEVRRVVGGSSRRVECSEGEEVRSGEEVRRREEVVGGEVLDFHAITRVTTRTQHCSRRSTWLSCGAP